METKSLTPFAFGDSLVRIARDDNGEPWFVAKDVCKILEIEKYRDAISRLDDDERGSEIVDTPGGPQTMTTISESGLYALVFRSRKPEARAFSKWVRSEVLPQIRKTGHYGGSFSNGHGHSVTPIPESVIEHSLELRPAMRQRLWRDALDTARLDGGGIELACQCFETLCDMMSAKRRFPDAESLIMRFMDECLDEGPGFTTPFRKIEQAFQKWWNDFATGERPGSKTLAIILRTRFEAVKSSVMVFRNCRICEAA